jgi:hypothetical protein
MENKTAEIKTKEQRVKEIVNGFKSFNKETYPRAEQLDELLALQNEVVEIALGEDAVAEKLRIYDVLAKVKKRCNEHGGISKELVEAFEKDCKSFNNAIRGTIGGNIGEEKTFEVLANMSVNHVTLENVELCDENNRSELDAVVITRGGAFIVEIKNSRKNIFIDRNGKYFRKGEYNSLDCNIVDKMEVRKKLLRPILDKNGFEHLPIFSIVVFTNDRIEIQNKHDSLNVGFLSQLESFICEDREAIIFDSDLKRVKEAIEIARMPSQFAFKDFDVPAFKERFATLMVELNDEFAPEIEIISAASAKDKLSKEMRIAILETIGLERAKKRHMIKCASMTAIFAVGLSAIAMIMSK